MDSGRFIVAIGYVGWFGSWTAASNGTQVYADSFYLGIFNIENYADTLAIAVEQNGVYVYNTSVTVGPAAEDGVTLNLPTNPSWVNTVLLFEGVATWNGQVTTPASLFPSYLSNVGAIDLMALIVVSFSLITVYIAVWCARRAAKRAGWAPVFKMLYWGHVVLVGLAAVVFADYQFINQTFAGYSPLVYPWALFPVAFATSIWWFNRAPRVEILQGVGNAAGEMGYRRTLVRVGVVAGKLRAIGESWGDFWARFWHYAPVIDAGDEIVGHPLFIPVENLDSPTGKPKRRTGRRRKVTPTANANPLVRFPVWNADEQEDEVAYIAWARADFPPIRYPRLRWSRVHTSRPIYAPSSVADAPILIRPSVTKRKLSWPHYEDTNTSVQPLLEEKHYLPAAMVWAGFAAIRDLGRITSKLGSALAATEAHIEQRVQDEVYGKLKLKYALIGRATSGLSEEESTEVSGRVDGLLDGARKEG